MTSLAIPSARPFAVRSALDLLRSHPREAGAALVMAAIAATSVAAVAMPHDEPAAEARAVKAAPQVQAMTPFAVRQVAPSDAVRLNAAVPLAGGPNPAALPFVLKADTATYARALECLSQAIYYEAARESEDGQRAVAQVILNRMRHPAYPASVCAVVYQGSERQTGCQFSFTCDGSLARTPMRGYWDRARRVAHAALQGYVHTSVGNATHYHADYVAPYWAPTLVKNAVIGAHIFYRWPGGWGRPTAFSQKWSKRESDPWALRSAALAAEARFAALPATSADTPADTVEMVVVAKRELPPELARLVDAEIGAKGTRVTLKGAVPAREHADTSESLRALDEAIAAPTSTSLNWGLSGKDAQAAEQAPLGRKDGSGATSAAD